MKTFFRSPNFLLIVTGALVVMVMIVLVTGSGSFSIFAQSDNDISAKVDQLLAQMTLEEKIGQMTQVDLTALKNETDIETYFIGSVLAGGNSEIDDISPQGWADYYDRIQKHALQTRLKIPVIFGIDAVHGHNNVQGAVIFPHNIGLGCTNNPALVEKASRITALEMAGTGIDWDFGPCVAVVRNERWGRTYESFGESPDIVRVMSAAAVRGLQENSIEDGSAVAACAKHFVGDGGTTDGVDQGNCECDEETLRKIHLPGYIEAMKAGTKTIMVSFSSWNGTKMHGHRYLLTDVLKGELGFGGFLVSDWAAIDQLPGDYKSDIENSINAGLDMIMITAGPGAPNNYVEFIENLKDLVNEGKVPLSRIDDAARRILRVKYELDIFGHPFTDSKLTEKIGSAEHREVARQCVRESQVLLKNENRILPLSKNLKHILVAGKIADDIGSQCGGWTISWQGESGNTVTGGTTILQAIQNSVSPETRVSYSADGSQTESAEVGIVVVGETPYAEMEGDRDTLALSAQDMETIGSV